MLIPGGWGCGLAGGGGSHAPPPPEGSFKTVCSGAVPERYLTRWQNPYLNLKSTATRVKLEPRREPLLAHESPKPTGVFGLDPQGVHHGPIPVRQKPHPPRAARYQQHPRGLNVKPFNVPDKKTSRS